MSTADPHANQPLVQAGAPLGEGAAAVVMVHGRGAAPANILDLVPELGRPDLTYLAPAAANRTWYPFSFMAEVESNEPGLSSALRMLDALVGRIESAGVPKSRIVMLGFSQGACLTSEFAVRHAGRFGGFVIFTGGAIGPAGTTWADAGDFAGTPIFMGCSDQDAHVPESRVHETAEVFTRRGAAVDVRIYRGMGHVVNEDEIQAAREILDRAAGR